MEFYTFISEFIEGVKAVNKAFGGKQEFSAAKFAYEMGFPKKDIIEGWKKGNIPKEEETLRKIRNYFGWQSDYNIEQLTQHDLDDALRRYFQLKSSGGKGALPPQQKTTSPPSDITQLLTEFLQELRDDRRTSNKKLEDISVSLEKTKKSVQKIGGVQDLVVDAIEELAKAVGIEVSLSLDEEKGNKESGAKGVDRARNGGKST